MPLPAGITTATVTFGKAQGVLGTEATITGTVAVDRPIVWSATGDMLYTYGDPVTSGPGNFLSFQFPHVDQPGFVDEGGHAVTNFAGILTATITFAKQSFKVTKPFQVFAGQTTVDLDLVPGGSIVPGVTAPSAAVLSVAGETGNVDADSLKAAIGAMSVTELDTVLPGKIADSEDPVGAALTATFATFVDLPDAPTLASESVRALIAVEHGQPLPDGLRDGDLVLTYSVPPGQSYVADFTGDAIGATPAGWTPRWGSTPWTIVSRSGTSNGKALRAHPGAAGRFALTLDAVDADPDRADSEVLMRWAAQTSAGIGPRPQVRVSGASGTESGYRGGINSAAQQMISKYVAGATSNIATIPRDPAFVVGAWYLTRFRAQGETLYVKTWLSGTDEPGAWDGSVTDTSLATGSVGIVAAGAAMMEVDWIAVATGGRTARR